MYAFLLRPKWILFHLVVIAAIAGMFSASRWQWDKYNDRDEFVALVEARQDRDATPPVPLAALLTGTAAADIEQTATDLGALEYRIATASGSYAANGQLLQINRTQDGVNGVNVLTPFQIEGGPIVIVNRGFVPDAVDPPPPPSGPLVIGGTVRLSQQRRIGELTDVSEGESDEVRRVDLSTIAERLGIAIAPVYLEFIASDPASPTPPIPVSAPNLSGGPPHLSYAIQWVVFSIAVSVGWVLAVRRSMRTRRRSAATGTTAATAAADERISAGAEPPARPSA